ncbi:hypothetical protein BDA99DRAFT_538261 [Phascolomyces articulosus]|uniref:Uncharacterized protein n=1 Tax=Phascolomyces articulosus TaxID=60185 RepID=A0AAD5JYH4_9FUNG|nr:hypothetical protein BDA99DRAFT_538261 [Phascolomyces articulosus]
MGHKMNLITLFSHELFLIIFSTFSAEYLLLLLFPRQHGKILLRNGFSCAMLTYLLKFKDYAIFTNKNNQVALSLGDHDFNEYALDTLYDRLLPTTLLPPIMECLHLSPQQQQ